MKLKHLYITAILIFLMFTAVAQENTTEKRFYNTKRISNGPPKIDGLIDNNIWDIVEWSGDFIQRSPNDGEEPSQETAFKVLYDDDNLYVLVRAFDTEPEKIVRRMSRRDGFDGDWVEVQIDSYFDKRTAFSFTGSVSGVKGDEMITDDGDRSDATWDPIWYLETSIDSLGWIAEMKIPFTQLRFSNHKESQIWGLQINRRFFRNEERSHWSHFSQDESGWVRHFGELQGIKNIKPKRQIEVSPYILAKTESYTKDEDNPFSEGFEPSFGAGIDGKIGITNDFTLDFTINPDFAQVEADDQAINLTRYSLFFPEKRRFFMERASIFEFSFGADNRLFYTRRIGLHEGDQVNIIAGGRLAGRIADWDIGVLNVQTGAEADLAAENFGVVRLRKQVINPYSYVGGMFTSRVNQHGHYNLGYGLDGVIRLFGDDYFSVNLAQTYTDTLSNRFDITDANRIRLLWERRSYNKFAYQFAVEHAGKDYFPASGFELRKDFSRYFNELSYGWTFKGHSFFQRHSVRGFARGKGANVSNRC